MRLLRPETSELRNDGRMNDSHIFYSVVIPAFNEAANLKPLYKRLKVTLESLGPPYEIIFVDDGSTDSTYQILKDIALADQYVKAISFIRNFGHHKAVVAGILEASGDYIITMDADLQNPPEEIPGLLEKAREGFDMVCGYRRNRKDKLSRRFCSFLVNLIISARTGLRMKDYGSMSRVFKRETAKRLADEFKKSQGYITMLVAKVTRNVAEVEVEHDERYSGESKYGIRKLFSAFWRVLFCYGDKHPGKESGDLYSIGKRLEYGQEKDLTSKDR